MKEREGREKKGREGRKKGREKYPKLAPLSSTNESNTFFSLSNSSSTVSLCSSLIPPFLPTKTISSSSESTSLSSPSLHSHSFTNFLTSSSNSCNKLFAPLALFNFCFNSCGTRPI